MSEDFNLEDLLKQFQQVKKLGDMGKLVQMLPEQARLKSVRPNAKRWRNRRLLFWDDPARAAQPCADFGPAPGTDSQRLGGNAKGSQRAPETIQQMRSVMRMMKGSKGREMIKKLAQNK
jgi:hypothetical protein